MGWQSRVRALPGELAGVLASAHDVIVIRLEQRRAQLGKQLGLLSAAASEREAQWTMNAAQRASLLPPSWHRCA